MVGVVSVACLLALVHHVTARRSTDGVRRAFQLAILCVSLGIVVAAVAL